MKTLLKSNIEKTTKQIISDNDFEQFYNLMFEKTFDKKDFIIEEGKFCNYIYFIGQGSAYSYMIDEKNAIQFALLLALSLDDMKINELTRQRLPC